jgi:hypothetical protein
MCSAVGPAWGTIFSLKSRQAQFLIWISMTNRIKSQHGNILLLSFFHIHESNCHVCVRSIGCIQLTNGISMQQIAYAADCVAGSELG